MCPGTPVHYEQTARLSPVTALANGIPFKPPTKPGGFPTIMVEIPQMIVG